MDEPSALQAAVCAIRGKMAWFKGVSRSGSAAQLQCALAQAHTLEFKPSFSILTIDNTAALVSIPPVGLATDPAQAGRQLLCAARCPHGGHSGTGAAQP